MRALDETVSRFMDQFAAPRIVLTGLRLFNEPVSPGPDAPLQAPVHQSKALVLNHRQNDFTITYAALEYRAPGEVQYQYRLIPHDKGWVDAGVNRRAQYSGFGAGTYTFEVRAVNGVGIGSETTTSIRVEILPPWWKTWWAYTLYGLLFFGGG